MSRQTLFYEGAYYLFSNFSAHEVVYQGVTYKTSEHAYQTAKFSDPMMREKIMNAPSAFLSRELGQAQLGLTGNFDKVAVMTDIMRAKLQQHFDVKQMLLQTGDAEIIKNHPDDYFWGSGADGTGKNMMGKIWMQLRSEIL